MQLNAEQREQLQQAKARGERHVTLSFTPEQKRAWREAAEQELAGKEENIVHLRKIKAAAEQPGFFGDIRRAILLSRFSTGDLATTIGVDWRVFSDFQSGETQLPTAALDRLIEALGLRLMQEIPR